MDNEQPRPRIPNIQFRVLIIGRANAGKTSILQRICETTESPIVQKHTKSGEFIDVREAGQLPCLIIRSHRRPAH